MEPRYTPKTIVPQTPVYPKTIVPQTPVYPKTIVPFVAFVPFVGKSE